MGIFHILMRKHLCLNYPNKIEDVQTRPLSKKNTLHLPNDFRISVLTVTHFL